MGSVATEGHPHRSDSTIPEKYKTSPIDSLSIDIASGRKNDNVDRCNHFSIRGYVAEVRKRDRKICCPFCSDSDDSGLVGKIYELPPLDVPEFRWWRCSSCLQRSGLGEEVLILPDGCKNGTNCKATCSHQKSIEGDGPALLLKDNGQTSKIRDGQNCEASTSTDSNDNRNCASLCCHRQGKGVVGCQYSLAKKSNQGIIQPTSDAMKVDVLEQDKHADDSVVHKSIFNAVVESHLRKQGPERAGEAQLTGRNSNCKDVIIPEALQQRRKAYNGGQQKESLANEVAVAIDRAINATKVRAIPLPDLNKSDDGNAERDEVMAGIYPCDDDEDDLSGDRQRKRKTRSLSELLGLEENGVSQPAARENVLPPDLPNRSTGRALLSVPQGEALVNENSNFRYIGQKKRKTSNDEGHRPLEIRDSSKGTRNVRTHDIDKENSTQSTESSDSESEEDASGEIVYHTVTERQYKHALEKNHELEKQAKRNRVENGDSTSLSRQKASPKIIQEKAGSADKQISAADGNRRMDQLDKSLVMVQQTEKTCTGVKKKKKIPQIRKEQPPAFPWKSFVSGECSATKENIAFTLTSGNHGQIQPVIHDSAGTTMHQFTSRHLSIGNAPRPVSPVQDGFHLPCARQELILVDDDHVFRKGAENKSRGGSSTFHIAAADASFTKGPFFGNKERSACQKSNSKGKQKLIQEVEGGGLPLVEHMVSLHKHKGLTAEVQGHMRDIDINSIPMDDKVLEQGHLDDIPMDIVELMAKHQHERRTDGGSDKHFTLGPNSYLKNPNPIGTGGSLQGIRPLGMSNVWQEHVPSMPRPQASNARNGMMRGIENAGSMKQKLLAGHFPEINRTHFNIGNPKDSYSSGRFVQYPEHMSNELRFSSLGLTSNNLNGNTSAQRSPSGFLQGFDSFNKCLAVSQQNSGIHAWPSGMPNRSPLGIGNSGMISQCSDKQKGNQDSALLSFNVVPVGKQSTNLSKSWNSKLAEYSSAMQLLNLMHNGGTRPTTVPYAVDGNLTFSKWPNQQYSHCAAGQNFGAYKAGSNSRQPSVVSNGRMPFPEKPHPCYSTIPGIRAFTSPLNTETSPARISSFMNPFSFPSQEQRNVENYNLSPQGGDFSHPQMTAAPSRHFGRKQQLVSALDKGKGIAGASILSIPPLQIQENLTNRNQSETQHGVRAVLPTPRTEVCALNQNPAEFIDLNLARKYMIGPEDLRCGKGSREKSSRSRLAAKKQEKMLRLAANKEHESHRKS
ncbi:hypothetical protein Ancab_002151 [Ancistrocladus abbreviatus]